jgi:hypothetical protein
MGELAASQRLLDIALDAASPEIVAEADRTGPVVPRSRTRKEPEPADAP